MEHVERTSRAVVGNILLRSTDRREEDPEEAIHLYTERGRSLIAERGRDNYREAAKYFQRVKALYERTQPGAFSDLLEALYDDELYRLPAARDEFEQAGLL